METNNNCFAIWLRDGRELQAMSQREYNELLRQLKHDRFVEFNGMAVESDLVTFLHDITPFEVDVVDDPDDEKEHKTGFTRNQGSRANRSPQQIKQQNNALVKILANHGDPMELSDIIAAMQDHGFNWTNNNASGHVKFAIKKGWNIERVGYGLYAYKATPDYGSMQANLFNMGGKK